MIYNYGSENPQLAQSKMGYILAFSRQLSTMASCHPFIAGPARAALATLAVLGNTTTGLAARRGGVGTSVVEGNHSAELLSSNSLQVPSGHLT